jgi:hypothetical protein
MSTYVLTSSGAVQNLSATYATWVGLYWVETRDHQTLVQGIWESLNCLQMLMTHVSLDLTQQKLLAGTEQHDNNNIYKLNNGCVQHIKLHWTCTRYPQLFYHIYCTLVLRDSKIEVLLPDNRSPNTRQLWHHWCHSQRSDSCKYARTVTLCIYFLP